MSAPFCAVRAAHPYEEVAYDLFPLRMTHQGIGSGFVGRMVEAH